MRLLLFFGFWILIVAALLRDAEGRSIGGSNPPMGFSGAFTTPRMLVDSVDSTDQERRTGPTTRTDHSVDSIDKPIVVHAKWIDTAGLWKYPELKHIEMTGGLFTGGLWNIRDSSWEFHDTLCIKWKLKFMGPNKPWQIMAIDTCTGTVCDPVIGDDDRVYHSACDSIRIVSEGPQLDVVWRNDTLPTGGVRKALHIKIDTIVVPVVFQIFRSRGLPTNSGTMTDTGITPLGGWFNVGGYNSTVTGFPVGKYYSTVKSIAWTAKNNSQTIIGGEWITSQNIDLASHKQLLLKWVTNPSTRSGGNNKTRLTLWKSDIYNGGNPPAIPDVTNIGDIEIEDNYGSTSQDTTSWLVTVVVWLLCLSS